MEGQELSVINLYSYRKRVAEGEAPDVYDFVNLPHELRVQIVYIWRDSIGRYYENSRNQEVWQEIHDIVAREHGEFKLGKGRNAEENCSEFLLNNTSVDNILDLIEASFVIMEVAGKNLHPAVRRKYGIKVTPDKAVAELNMRFQRAGIGYRYENKKIFRVDSELIHAEVVQPALQFLHKKGFEGPRDEFMKAHGHYRAGETKDAITDANNAFESTLKAICNQRNWQYPKGARASDLLNVVRENGLLPSYLDNSFDQLSATLKSGLPKVRGEEGAHGQGAKPRETPDYVASYALHLAAAKILFLVEAHEEIG